MIPPWGSEGPNVNVQDPDFLTGFSGDSQSKPWFQPDCVNPTAEHRTVNLQLTLNREEVVVIIYDENSILIYGYAFCLS